MSTSDRPKTLSEEIANSVSHGFGVLGGLALLGVVLKVSNRLNRPIFSLGLYLAMGWLVAIAIKPLLSRCLRRGLWWLVAGVVAYICGIVFFVLDFTWRYSHFIWHMFVLASTACHLVRYAYG